MRIPLQKGGICFRVPCHCSSLLSYSRRYRRNVIAVLLCAALFSLSLQLIFPMPAYAATLTLDLDSGMVFTVITITGSGFPGSTGGVVWFDNNDNGVKDSLEPYKNITTTSGGDIPSGVTLTVPKVPGGLYQVLADIPDGSPVEASADFTVVPGLS